MTDRTLTDDHLDARLRTLDAAVAAADGLDPAAAIHRSHRIDAAIGRLRRRRRIATGAAGTAAVLLVAVAGLRPLASGTGTVDGPDRLVRGGDGPAHDAPVRRPDSVPAAAPVVATAVPDWRPPWVDRRAAFEASAARRGRTDMTPSRGSAGTGAGLLLDIELVRHRVSVVGRAADARRARDAGAHDPSPPAGSSMRRLPAAGHPS